MPEIDGPVTGSEARTLGPRAAKLRPADGQVMDVRESRAMPKRLTSAPGQSLSCHGLVFFRPVLWAASTHFDKFLVERSSEHSDVAVPLPFAALVGILTSPFIAYFERTILEPSAANIPMIIASGVLSVAPPFYLHALLFGEASVVAPFFQTVPLFGYALAGSTRVTRRRLFAPDGVTATVAGAPKNTI